MDTLFPRWYEMKKDKNELQCQKKHKHFSLFIFLVDRMLRKGAKVELTHGKKKWNKPFCTLKFGLTSGLQLQLKGSTPGCSTEIGYQVLYGPVSHNVCLVWNWAWINNFLSPRYFHAHLHNFTHLNPPIPLGLHNALYFLNPPSPLSPMIDRCEVPHGYVRR